MKATIEFDLWGEREEFKHAMNGVEYSIALSEIKEFLRRKRKYGMDDGEDLDHLINKLYDFIPENIE